MSITYEVLNYNKKWQIIFNYDTTESCCFCGETLDFYSKGGLHDYEYSIPSRQL